MHARRLPVLPPGLDPAGSSSTAFVPRRADGRPAPLPELARAAQACTGCGLWERATQAVFGDGPLHASVFLVGEQPGDAEDRKGRPFVGPAGGMRSRALEEAGIARDDVYVTNAVKHFSFVQQGTRRLHQKPKAREVRACQGWLAAEIEVVQPRLVVCLGATAALSVLGPRFRLTEARGQVLRRAERPAVMATYHPSALLRAPDAPRRHQMYAELVADLRGAARVVSGGSAGA